MINSISLLNWRSHENSHFEFSKGTNLLVGIMGSGKSSVVDGLCFALFGNFPALQHRKVKLSDIIRSRPVQEQSANAKVEFEIGGEKYSVSRTIHLDGGSEAEIRKGGKLLEGPQPKRVNELVEKLLSIDYDLFTRAIYSEQNNIDYFLELQRGDRKKQIDQLLGIDRFETVRTEAVKAINRLKEARAEKAALVKESDKEKAEKELEKSRMESKKLEDELRGIASALQESATKKSALESILRTLESQRIEHRKHSDRKAGLSHTLESSCRRLKCRPEEFDEKQLSLQAESIRQKTKSQKHEQAAQESSVSRLTSEIASQKSRLLDISEKAERKIKLESELFLVLSKKSATELEKETTELSSSINSGAEEVGKLRAGIADGLEANNELEKGIGKCPVCEAPLSEERKRGLLEKRATELGAIDGRLKALEKDLGHRQAQLRKLQERLAKANSLEAKLSELKTTGAKDEFERSIAGLEKQKQEAELTLKGLKESLSLCEESLRSFEEKMQLAIIARELTEVEKRLIESKFDEGVYEKTRGELESARILEGTAKAKKEGLEREAGRIQETIRLQSEKLAQIGAYSKSIAGIDSSLEELSIFLNCVTDTQRELREELITAISHTMSQVWPYLYPYGDYSELRLKADDKGYELEARTRDDWVSVDGVASGGERATACLALRIAFAMVLAPNLNWLILDEPTHNLDEEAVRSLASALYEKIPEIVEQAFVITHEENLKDAASGSLYKISRNKSEDGPSKAEKL